MNPIEKIKNDIQACITDAINKAQADGVLNIEQIPDFVVEVPREKEHGDFAVNAAMLLARQAKMAPKKIADIIVNNIKLNNYDFLESVNIAGAGFINFKIKTSWLYSIPAIVLNMGNDYGKNEDKSLKVQVEFVSANPTGNLHMGNARGGAIGDTLANVLVKAGYTVEREFYINDAGNQIDIFTDSLEARYFQLMGQDVQFPENGYAGQDVVETVKNIIKLHGDTLLQKETQERRSIIVEYALNEKITYIKQTLEKFHIFYDEWFSEQSLHNSNKINEVITFLKEKDYIYENEGALWFKSTLFGDEKDEVVVRANGIPTYFAADIAYHLNKFERGFDWVINVWGADHHGHVARMKGAIEALGHNPEKLDIVLMQLVRLYRGGEIVRMSKRTGTLITLNELVEEVGKDAARFFFVMRSPDSHLDFDLELARKQSQENPVYYVQYAHARICSIFRQAESSNVNINVEKADFSLLKQKEELDLLRKIADFPEEIAIAARTLAPHRIARYVLDLSGLFHSFYNFHRVLNENESLQNARLLLMLITKTTIRNSLDILGVNAPEQM